MSYRGVRCLGTGAPELFATISAATTLGDSELLKLDVHISGVSAVALVGSGASHCFISDTLAARCNVQVDCSSKLSVQLANGEIKSSLGVARGIPVQLAPGVVYPVDLWVVPLTFALILGTLWLRTTQPAIDWSCHRVIFVHNTELVTVYGRGGFPPPPARPTVDIVGAHRFGRDLSCDQYVSAYMGLLSAPAPPSVPADLSPDLSPVR